MTACVIGSLSRFGRILACLILTDKPFVMLLLLTVCPDTAAEPAGECVVWQYGSTDRDALHYQLASLSFGLVVTHRLCTLRVNTWTALQLTHVRMLAVTAAGRCSTGAVHRGPAAGDRVEGDTHQCPEGVNAHNTNLINQLQNTKQQLSLDLDTKKVRPGQPLPERPGAWGHLNRPLAGHFLACCHVPVCCKLC